MQLTIDGTTFELIVSEQDPNHGWLVDELKGPYYTSFWVFPAELSDDGWDGGEGFLATFYDPNMCELSAKKIWLGLETAQRLPEIFKWLFERVAKK